MSQSSMSEITPFFQSGFLARQKNLLARKRRLSEKSCVLGKNEQWLG